MTWIGEVAHVAWKDVRQQRWLILAYVALVIIATCRAVLVALADRPPNILTAVLPLILVLGCLLTAIFVQGDSPTRADAFWLTRPLHPSAVLAAKLLLVATIIVGVPMLGQAAALSLFQIGRSVSGLLWASLTIYGAWLLVAMLLGGLTGDLRSFVVAFLVVLIAVAIAIGVLLTTRDAPPLEHAWKTLFGVVAAVGTIAVLAVLYGRRGWLVPAWIAAGLTMSAAIAATFDVRPDETEEMAGVDVGPLELRVKDPDMLQSAGRIDLSISAPNAPDSIATAFLPTSVRIHLLDGSEEVIGQQSMPVALRLPDLPVGEKVRWLGRKMPVGFATELTIPLTVDQRKALAAGVRDIEATGLVATFKPHLLGSMPLEVGSTLRSEGQRTRLMRIDRFANEIRLELRSARVARDESVGIRFMFLSSSRLEFALANPSRAEALPLHEMNGGNSGEWLVLPGTSFSQSSFGLQTASTRVPEGSPPDDAWLRDARLVVGEWVFSGKRPATARTVPHTLN